MGEDSYRGRIDHIGSITKQQINTINDRCGKPPQIKIMCMPTLERMLWGFQKRKLYVVGSRTSHGKSVFLLQLAYDFALQGKVVHFHSFEMTKESCAERLIANRCKIDNYLLTTGKIDEPFLRGKYSAIIKKHIEEAQNTKLVFIESIGNNLPALEELHNFFNEKPDVIFIDYGNLVADQQYKSKKQSYDEYIKGLRAMAINKNICVVMAAQINRNVAQNDTGSLREPELFDFKDTGVLEENTDVCLLLFWKDRESPDYIMNVAKNRDGMVGKIPCLFHGCFCRIEENTAKIDEKRKERREGKDVKPKNLSGDRRFSD